MRHPRGPSARRPGFALPMTLLVIVLLTVALAAMYTVTSSERRVVDNQREQIRAFALAETGLELFLGNRAAYGFTGVPGAAPESTRIALTSGYADVIMTRVRPTVGLSDPVFVVRSRGVSTSPRLSDQPMAERTVAQYAIWKINPMPVVAGWTSLSGLAKTGTSGTLSGVDACTPAQASVAGVATPTGGYTGPSAPLSGNPAQRALGTQEQANTAVDIDWAGIVAGTALAADITIPSGSWPSFTDASYWPVIKADGDFTMPGSGRGLLIVTGNLTVAGSDTWNGVVLVGGNLTSNGNNTVSGAVVTGLNVKLGQTVPPNSLGNGNKTFRYNSCNVMAAMSRFQALHTWPNAWVDNWPSY